MVKKISIVLVILAFGTFLRFYDLTNIPNGFYVDEAVIGYNAYSLVKTGRDEYGKAFPIFLRSFSAYSSPLYTYMTAIPVYFFGLSVFNVRLVSAISGSLAIIFVFLITKMLFSKDKKVPYIGSLVFAISPWTIFFSRGSYEANFALLLFLTTIYLFLKSQSKKSASWLVLSFFVLSLTTYAYQPYRLLAYLTLPLLYLYEESNFLLFLQFKQLKLAKMKNEINSFVRKKKRWIFALFLFLIIQAPQLVILKTPAFTKRAGGLFYKDAVLTQAGKISYLPKIVSIPLAFLREFLAQYFSYFSPENLFLLGDADPQRSIPELSVFYFWMIVPYLIGLFYLFKKRKNKNVFLVISFLAVSAFPAAFTRDPFSSLRSLTLVFPMTIVISLGISRILRSLPVYVKYFLSILVISYSLMALWRSYFVLFPYERAKVWGYGYDKIADFISSHPDTQFIVDQTRMKPFYIQYAFFTKLNPFVMQASVNPNIKNNYYEMVDFDNHYRIENMQTRAFEWSEDIYKKQILIGDTLSVSEKQAKEHFLEKVLEVENVDGEILFTAFATNPDKKCQTEKNDIHCKSNQKE